MNWRNFINEQGDTRRLGRRIIGTFQHSVPTSLIRIIISGLIAYLVFFVVSYGPFRGANDLGLPGEYMLFILLFAAGLWVSEAIPAFAVSLVVIALEIAILGRPGGVFAAEGNNKVWEMFIHPWSSPLIWLFLGGFVLAHAAVKTGLDHIVARRIISLFGNRPKKLLFGVMLVTFTLSMFMSNTATAAMMIALLRPVIASLEIRDRYAKGLVLGVAMASSVGGMGTIIGTPPNAIAAQALSTIHPVSFLSWILIGLPPALVLFVISWIYLTLKFPSDKSEIPLSALDRTDAGQLPYPGSSGRHNLWVVLGVFTFAILMWLFESVHSIPAPVIAFFAISILSVSGVVTAQDMRSLPWDVLILMAGGLSLGVGVQATGLSDWIVSFIPMHLNGSGLVLFFAVMAVVMSNFMSNTATASIVIPVVSGFSAVQPHILILPVALACSCAMILPVSTPPNAVAFASGHLKPSDFLWGGILMALIGPIVILLWMRVLFP